MKGNDFETAYNAYNVLELNRPMSYVILSGYPLVLELLPFLAFLTNIVN